MKAIRQSRTLSMIPIAPLTHKWVRGSAPTPARVTAAVVTLVVFMTGAGSFAADKQEAHATRREHAVPSWLYDGYLSVETQPEQEPYETARRGIEVLEAIAGDPGGVDASR